MSTARTTEPAELDDYRVRAREWLAANLNRVEGADPDLVGDPSPERVAEAKRIQALLHAAGYAGFTFPVEHGGQGLTLDHERVFLQEAAGYDVPTRFFGVSINILGATLAAYGTHEQKERHLRPILSGEEIWLQLLSEPGGGSDLAGLLMRADRRDDTFLVNGQKTWSTGAHFADFALCPVRTNWDVPKHRGISLLIVDLRAPGLEIRPIRQINGEEHFCEEFFTDVEVPAANLVGEQDQGWRVIRGLLEIEHAWVGRGGAKRVDFRADVSDLVALVRSRGLTGDDGARRTVTGLHVMLQVQKLVAARVSHGIETGRLDHGYGSLLKMGNDTLAQRGAEAALAIGGAAAATWEPGDAGAGGWVEGYLTSRSAPIAGGSAEILRNNVSEKVLGLPREPSLDRNLPFNQVPHN
ncbi:acyl-CoA dehydrogenase family protein [Frankia sp. AgB1.9]|uniref:acyl-CoA dehydrogenase family protein n=1 Tax=unclassified Frankia TaxID=2632575 RepID=UPI0019323172|nr:MULTISPECIES: acyl-CoA dehydrogenase family protein [unclassified Frankia]MBL7494119.1 acyl-CoA dehydrogenase family protein [Frankia sp. AgW1.1]MBL7551100.1 acyl-CoA dehydrogenase family protein [Frankia sp. AgB1.9]MBL7624734.1 acyl-CoA dehydrogenase family protein [Frankia sp. AgB1.8]